MVGVRFNLSLKVKVYQESLREQERKKKKSLQNAGKSTRSCKTSPDVGSVSIKWGN